MASGHQLTLSSLFPFLLSQSLILTSHVQLWASPAEPKDIVNVGMLRAVVDLLGCAGDSVQGFDKMKTAKNQD